MNHSIRPEDITALAAYVEAGDQLSKCEFFGEDHPTVIQGESATFGPASELVAALGPFRRIWMQTEMSNFYLAVSAIERNSPDARRKGIAAGQK